MARSLGILSFAFSMIFLTMAAEANDFGDCNQTADAHRWIKGCTAILKRAYIRRGNVYFNNGKYGEAIADYNRAIELDPNYGPAYNSRGYAYYAQGEDGKAIADYSRAIELNPKDELAYYNRGYAYYKRDEYGKAIADFDRAIELEPKSPGAYIGRGTAYIAQRQYGKAIADENHAIALNPGDKLAYYAYINRGSAHSAKGEYEKAIADYNRAIELKPENAATLRQLGAVKFDAGDFKGASGDLLRSLELKDEIYAMLFRYLARARAGETPAAAELEANSGRLMTKEWPYAVVELYLGKRSLELTLDAAAKPEEKCEAQFYIGEWYVLQNKPAKAQAALAKAAGTCPTTLKEYHSALAELRRLKP